MENETNTISNILFISIFLIVMILGMVIIISSLNNANVQIGVEKSGIGSETLYNILNTPQTLEVNNLTNPQCTIISVSVHGWEIPTSDYTVDNCFINYTGVK